MPNAAQANRVAMPRRATLTCYERQRCHARRPLFRESLPVPRGDSLRFLPLPAFLVRDPTSRSRPLRAESLASAQKRGIETYDRYRLARCTYADGRAQHARNGKGGHNNIERERSAKPGRGDLLGRAAGELGADPSVPIQAESIAVLRDVRVGVLRVAPAVPQRAEPADGISPSMSFAGQSLGRSLTFPCPSGNTRRRHPCPTWSRCRSTSCE